MTVAAPSALPTGEYEMFEAAAPGTAASNGIKLIFGLLATLLLAYAADLVLHGRVAPIPTGSPAGGSTPWSWRRGC
jgi:hypothetical protein